MCHEIRAPELGAAIRISSRICWSLPLLPPFWLEHAGREIGAGCDELDLGGRNFVASCHEIPSAGAGGAIRIYPRISWSPLVLTPVFD